MPFLTQLQLAVEVGDLKPEQIETLQEGDASAGENSMYPEVLIPRSQPLLASASKHNQIRKFFDFKCSIPARTHTHTLLITSKSGVQIHFEPGLHPSCQTVRNSEYISTGSSQQHSAASRMPYNTACWVTGHVAMSRIRL